MKARDDLEQFCWGEELFISYGSKYLILISNHGQKIIRQFIRKDIDSEQCYKNILSILLESKQESTGLFENYNQKKFKSFCWQEDLDFDINEYSIIVSKNGFKSEVFIHGTPEKNEKLTDKVFGAFLEDLINAKKNGLMFWPANIHCYPIEASNG